MNEEMTIGEYKAALLDLKRKIMVCVEEFEAMTDNRVQNLGYTAGHDGHFSRFEERVAFLGIGLSHPV